MGTAAAAAALLLPPLVGFVLFWLCFPLEWRRNMCWTRLLSSAGSCPASPHLLPAGQPRALCAPGMGLLAVASPTPGTPSPHPEP